MRLVKNSCRLGCWFGLVAAWFAAGTVVADWPCYRGDEYRTGYRDQPLAARSWIPAWRFDGLSRPSPAWPGPARGSLWQNLDTIAKRIVDDGENVPLLVNDRQGELHVLVTSIGDHRIVSLDPVSGRMEWQIFADAPIRFAPAIDKGRAYFGADDGLLRAVDIAAGEVVWQSRLGPDSPWIVGNGRPISPFPIRTSVIVHERTVIAHAGLFPSQGVYVVAVDVDDGDLVWRRRVDRSPQGYLLSTDDQRIIVPCGRSTPYAINPADGSLMDDLPSPGGSFCMVSQDAFFSGPGNSGDVQLRSAVKDGKLLPFAGKLIVAGGGYVWSADTSQLSCYRLHDLLSREEPAPRWQVDCPVFDTMLVSGRSRGEGSSASEFSDAGRRLFAAVDSAIQIYDADSGRLLTTLELEDKSDAICQLAVSSVKEGGDLLVATTEAGSVYAWRGAAATSSADATESPKLVEWPKSFRAPSANAERRRSERRRSERSSVSSSVGDQGSAPETAGNSRFDSQLRLSESLSRLLVPRGLVLIDGDEGGILTEELLKQRDLYVVTLVSDADVTRQLRQKLVLQGHYGARVTVLRVSESAPLPFTPRLFNLVVASSNVASHHDLKRMVAHGGILSTADGDQLVDVASTERVGSWTHQYGNGANTADSGDALVGAADNFRLRWFGGVGPSRIPDRHLRGPAPLVAGATMVVHGDGVLIGVDPDNGIERWQVELPSSAMRYVMPFDGGYTSLSHDGSRLWVAAGKEIWGLSGTSGELLHQFELPAQAAGLQWGYLAEQSGELIASCMEPASPRLRLEPKAARENYSNLDYTSARPLVCSRSMHRLDKAGKTIWSYQPRGVIPNSTIAFDERRLLWIEGRSQACRSDGSARIPAETILEDGYLVCRDVKTGRLLWERDIVWPNAENMLYVQLANERVVLSTSTSRSDSANYELRVFGAANGNLIWEQQHRHIRKGLYHGEQVHHPVLLRQAGGDVWIVAEPFVYSLDTGLKLELPGLNGSQLMRPGHSCGTLTGAGKCLFFRASNPTALNLNANRESEPFTKLSPSRPSCWINMVPAAGKLLIPEGSASCVCNYSLQTSMAFDPLSDKQASHWLPRLEDVIP